MSISRIASGPGVNWHTVNDPQLATGRAQLIADPARYDAVRIQGW